MDTCSSSTSVLAPSPAKSPIDVAGDADSRVFRSHSFSSTSRSLIISTSRNIVSSAMVMVGTAPWGAGVSSGAKPSSSLSVDARAPDALGDVASESDSRDADPRSVERGASGNTE